MKNGILIVTSNKELQRRLMNECTSSQINYLYIDEDNINEFDILSKISDYGVAYFIIDALNKSYNNLRKILTLAKVKGLIKFGFIINNEIINSQKHIKDIVEHMDTTILTNENELIVGIKSVLPLNLDGEKFNYNKILSMFSGNLVGFSSFSKAFGEDKVQESIKSVFLNYYVKSGGVLPKKMSFVIECGNDFTENDIDELGAVLQNKFNINGRELVFSCVLKDDIVDYINVFMLGVI